MRKFFVIILVVLIIGIVSSGFLFLFPYFPNSPPVADDSGSTGEGIQQVVDANNEFAFDLYFKLDKEENLFYSPYSISTALSMVYEGAKGQTAEEIKSVLHISDSEILRPNFAAIYNKINTGNKEYELKTGNALWLQKDYAFSENYLFNVEKYYGGKASNLDFVNEPESSRNIINDFIEEQTNGKIKDLIPVGVFNSLTRMVLTNAIYFKGNWEYEFDKSKTKKSDFTISPGNVVQVDMMKMKPDEAEFNYASLDKLQILELPYKGDEISMLILLPKQGQEYNYETKEMITFNYGLKDIELSAEKLKEYRLEMQETYVENIYLPKFEFDTKYFIKEVLSDLGMPTAFTDGADFSGMTLEEQLSISSVIHQAYVKVDEKGTEAAAATAITMKAISAGPGNEFIADHPFIFVIQDKETGNILFLGKVVNPTQ